MTLSPPGIFDRSGRGRQKNSVGPWTLTAGFLVFFLCSTAGAQETPPAPVKTAASQTIPEAIHAAQDSVVSVHASYKETFRLSGDYGPIGTFFRHFFESKPRDTFHADFSSLGTGVIVEAETGLIITNYHVVQNARSIKVKTRDGRLFTAALQGYDRKQDLALLRVKTPENLKAVTWGDSSKVTTTEEVFAVGTPGGFEQTITKGIISTVDRDLMNGKEVEFEDMIQTDAPVNQGNSGGPLVNTRGEMIGLVTIKYGYGESIGFAIPSSRVRSVIEALKSGEAAFRRQADFYERFGFLPEVREINGKREFVVGDIQYRAKADKAGLRKDDILLSFNHQHFSDADHFIEQGLEIPEGRRVHIMIYRQKRPLFTYLEAA